MKVAISIPKHQREESRDLVKWCKSVFLADVHNERAADIAKRLGASDALVKALTPAHMTGDSDALANSLIILTEFVDAIQNISLFFNLLDNGAIKLPFQSRATIITGIAGSMVGEGQVIAVERATMAKGYLDPKKAAAIAVFSAELLKLSGPEGEAALNRALQQAIVPTVDAGFLSLITDGSTPTTVSAGSTVVAALHDLRWLLDQVNVKGTSYPVWAMSPDVGRAASMLHDGGLTFPEMSPTGGQMLNLPAYVIDGLDAGTIGLVDGTAVAANALGIEVKVSREASIQMNDAPDSPVTAATTTLPLWQNNLVALMPYVVMGATRLRDNAYAYVSGVTWGSPNSP